MKPLTCRSVLCLFLLAAAVAAPAFSQSAPPPPVEVSTVKFNSIRVGPGAWYEIEVAVQPKPGIGADNKNFLNRVKVTLNLGIFSVKAKQGQAIPDTYYRASAEAVAIETSGGKTFFRFYLPPEIVKRDQITGDQKFYLVELFVDGKPMPLAKEQTAFPKIEIVESFRSKVSSEAGVNDGILLPQYLTPFANSGNAPAPSFIRQEANR